MAVFKGKTNTLLKPEIKAKHLNRQVLSINTETGPFFFSFLSYSSNIPLLVLPDPSFPLPSPIAPMTTSKYHQTTSKWMETAR